MAQMRRLPRNFLFLILWDKKAFHDEQVERGNPDHSEQQNHNQLQQTKQTFPIYIVSCRTGWGKQLLGFCLNCSDLGGN